MEEKSRTNIAKNNISFQGEDYNKGSVKFEDLFQKREGEKLVSVLVTTYVCDWEWLSNCFEEETSLFVVVNWKRDTKESEQPLGTAFGEGTHKVKREFSRGDKKYERSFFVTHPSHPLGSSRKKINVTMHAKIMVAQFSERMR